MKQIALSLSLAGLAFLMTAIWGGPLLRILRYYKIGKIIRIEQPDSHRIKMGTPTMGGVMFIFPVLLFSGLLNAAALIGGLSGAQFLYQWQPWSVLPFLAQPMIGKGSAGNAKAMACAPVQNLRFN